MRRILSAALCAALMLTILGGCAPKGDTSRGATSSSAAQSNQQRETTTISASAVPIAQLKAVGRLAFTVLELAPPSYDFSLSATDAKLVDGLKSGALEFSILSPAAAAKLAAETDGAVQVLAVASAAPSAMENPDAKAQPAGCVVVGSEYVQNHGQAAEQLLSIYLQNFVQMKENKTFDSLEYLEAAFDTTIELADADENFVPQPLTLYTGEEMKLLLEAHYQALFQADPADIGGSMPYDSFYYGVQ